MKKFICRKNSVFFKIAELLFSVFLLFSFAGCKEKKNENLLNSENSSQEEIVSESQQKNIDYEAYSFISAENIFNLDYRPEKPEDESIPGKVNLNNFAPDSDGKPSTNEIPGLRNLDEYKTTYQKKRMSLSEYLEYLKKTKREIKNNDSVETSQNISSKKLNRKFHIGQSQEKSFYVKFWGPQESVPGELANPQFYMEFSLPLKSLEALKDQEQIDTEGKNIFTITPPVKGKYTFLGTKNISFIVEEPLDPMVEYTLAVNKNLVSKSGEKISGEKIFKTTTAPVRFVNVMTGNKPDSKNYLVNNTTRDGVSLYYAKDLRIIFTSYLSKEFVEKNLEVVQKNKKLNFEVKEDLDSKKTDVRVSPDQKKTNAFYVTIKDPLVEKALVTLKISDPQKQALNEITYFVTESMKLVEIESYCGNGYGTAYQFTFSQEIDKSSVKDAVTFKNEKLNDEQIYVYSRNLRVQYLNLKPEEKGVIEISTDLKSVNNENISENISYEIEGRDYRGYVNFLDYGEKILEAQFPHKILFEYMNVSLDSAYRVRKVENPLGSRGHFERTDSDAVKLDTYEMNVRNFQEIDLEPYLENGKGAVCFEADVSTQYYNWRDEKDYSKNTNYVTIQVTDLAATARIGINKAVIMVKSMEKNESVKNAEVWISGITFSGQTKYINTKHYRTDEDGYVIIPFGKEEKEYFEQKTKYGDRPENFIVVNVKTENDKVMFRPSTHSSWSYGIYNSDMRGAFGKFSRIFMFSDRGLYKPGETITFRGIDRNQQAGCFTSYNGKYKVSFENDYWRDQTVYETKYGTTSESGGFWGEFKIPEDVKPGTYCINYQRSDEKGGRKLYFTVAYFEALKIQSELKMDDGYFYAGDNLNAKITASYLAGGYLAGAEYDARWYSQPSRFHPSDRKFKNYTFGKNYDDYDDYDYRRLLSSESGILNNEGSAVFDIKTVTDLKGVPYEYRLEVDVTDVSNQRISAAQRKIVHPAFFYIGIGNSNNRGFAKKGDVLNFPIVLVTPEEKIFTDNKKISGQLKYSLTREYWTVNYKNSVNDSVYEHYVKHNDEEAKGTVSFDSKNIKVNVKNSGWYTLTVSGTDSNGKESISQKSFYVTGSDSFWWSNDSSSSIKLTPDQSLYNPGETAQILVESPLPAGDYLITVEREGIFTEEIKHFDEPCNVIEIPVARNYVPVVYVAVSSYSARTGEPVHQYGERDLDKPQGYFGVTSIMINPRVRAFSVSVETDKEIYKPGDMATVTLTATKGGDPVEGAELTCFAADRAVLDLINYHVPDPISYYYNKGNFPLRVIGGDSRDYLMDPVTYSIKNLRGGDASEDKDGDERKDFRPTAFFEPELITDAEGKVQCTFKVPDNLTTFRLTAFGVKGELLALQEDEFAVQNVINVQAVQPRRLRVRDTAECGVVITNLDSQGHDVTVSMQIRNPQKNYAEDEADGFVTVHGKAFVDGSNEKTVYVASGASSVVYFDVGAEEEGNVEFVYTVKSDIFSEKLVSKIKIEKTYVFETVALSSSIEYVENKSAEAEESVIIPSFAKDNLGNIKVTLDATQLGSLSSAVNYVFKYPYGCMEQQSSKVLPLVIFENYIKVFGIDSEVSNPRRVCKKYFRKWKDQQNEDGGFPYWPDKNEESNLYVSMRIALIYGLASERGYSASDCAINISKLKNYIVNQLEEIKMSEYKNYDDLISFACYVFALLDDSSFDEDLLELTKKDVTDLTDRAYLGLAWSLKSGADADMYARRCANQIKSYLRPTLRSVDVTRPSSVYAWRYYHTTQKELALITQLLVKMDSNDSMVDRLIYRLLEERSKGYWTNTITTASVLESIYTVIKERKLDTTDFVASASIMEKEILSARFAGVGAKPVSTVEYLNGENLGSLPRDEDLSLKFKMKGTGTLYYTAQMTYAIPDEVQNARNEGFEVTAKIYDYETNKEVPVESNGFIIPLESGKTYKIKVVVNSDKDHNYAALRVPVPSGAEILDSRFVTSGSDAEISSYGGHGYYNSRYIFDNEVQYFFNSTYKNDYREVEFTFRAARRGVYPVSPVQVECMYESEVFGRSDGYLYTIK